ncbi:reticuline oxidase [Quercus suber]|uniref:Reticuline oxidase n=1 Tax=Quercus suber TaxID=58331 RepID=A0AAW0JF62_QUESU
MINSCLTNHNIKNFTTFPGDLENDDQPTAYFRLNFSIQNLRFAESTIPYKPIAIILPETVDQLLHALICCREGSLEIRVRSGGHSYEGTSYVATDGGPFVIIDVMNLNRVLVDLETETAWVERGATLADNVVDALLIDANGQLLSREVMGDDVFWAIRGGGGGVWGILYSWKIKLLKVPPTVTAFTVSRPGTKGHVAELVNKWQYVAPYLEDNFYLSCFVGANLPEAISPGISASFNGFYLGPRSKAISILKQMFPELGIVEEDCKEMTWIESVVFFSGLSNGSSVSDLKNRYMEDKGFFKAKSDYVRAPISLMGIRAALNTLEKEPKGHIILDPYAPAIHVYPAAPHEFFTPKPIEKPAMPPKPVTNIHAHL